ncbi:MAG: hypothetical protein ABSA65_18230 [Acidimicrobiales bacterium]|jgi:hypothetical protein
MPRPVYGPTDYQNPDAPESERQLRADHLDVRDLSYDVGRVRQRFDLYKGAVIQTNIDGLTGDDLPDELPVAERPRPRLELFLKERPRGHGYVCDFLYESEDLPVTVYGTLVNHGRGLMVNELELWRGGPANRWEYRDAWNDYVGPGGTGLRPLTDLETYTGITPTLLRQLPLGQIVAAAQRSLARRDWDTDGVFVDGHRRVDASELPADSREALERGAEQAVAGRRGRPEIADTLLEAVASAYLEEAPGGAGLTRRLAERFNRPEPTVRDWVAAARRRGFLSAAQPGRRGAAPGPRLTDASTSRSPVASEGGAPGIGLLTDDEDDQLPLSREAFLLHTHGMVNAQHDGHPGFVPNDYLEFVSADTTVATLELCALGLWERTTGGYRVLDTDAVERISGFFRRRDELEAECERRGGHVPMAKHPDLCVECGARIDDEPLGDDHDPVD